VPEAIAPEQLAHLWLAARTPYRLSLAYAVSVSVLAPPAPPVAPVLPQRSS